MENKKLLSFTLYYEVKCKNGRFADYFFNTEYEFENIFQFAVNGKKLPFVDFETKYNIDKRGSEEYWVTFYIEEYLFPPISSMIDVSQSIKVMKNGEVQDIRFILYPIFEPRVEFLDKNK